MANRPQSIEGIAYGYDVDAVGVQNVTKALSKAPGRNSTAIGRGHREVPWCVEKLVSTALGATINDLKNCVRKVVTISELEAKEAIFVLHSRPNALFDGSFKESQEFFETDLADNSKDDLFNHICRKVVTIALEWGGDIHQDLRRGFQLIINTGEVPGAVMDQYMKSHSKMANNDWWLRTMFAAKNEQGVLASRPYSNSIQRQAVWSIEHLEVLAILYADTLRFVKADVFETLKTPSIEEALGLKSQVALEVTKENAGSPWKEPASTRYQDHTPIQATSILDNGQEREKTQALSVCGSGDFPRSRRNTTHVRSSPHDISHEQSAAA